MNLVKLMSGPLGHCNPAFSPALVCLHGCPALAWCSHYPGVVVLGCQEVPIAWGPCVSSAPLVCPCAQTPSSSAKQPAIVTCQYLVEVQTIWVSSYLSFVLHASSLIVCCSTSSPEILHCQYHLTVI